MISHPETVTDAEPDLAPVIYEQPLNERMRTFLRLEFLYTQATYHSELPNPWSARAAVASLLEILAITARGDSRSDVLKELERHVTSGGRSGTGRLTLGAPGPVGGSLR